jgi:two-component system, OmpR family, alkaline phosphatase synthesis response regulator PhoP
MNKHILLCDDEIHIVRAAEFKLKKAGYEVQIANDGAEAWEAIQRRIPDLLITDFQMPRMDGAALIEKVRGNPATANLPVFLLTAKGFELSHEDMVGMWNVVEVIAKPFSPRELLQRVDRTLQRSTVCETASARGAVCETPCGFKSDNP